MLKDFHCPIPHCGGHVYETNHKYECDGCREDLTEFALEVQAEMARMRANVAKSERRRHLKLV